MPQTIQYKPMIVAPSRPTMFQRLKAAYRSYTIGPIMSSDPELAKIFGVGFNTPSGVIVNARTAFTFSAVFDAVNQLSSDVAKLPLNLLKRRQEGGSDLYTDSKLYRLLKYEPNRDMGSMTFRRTLTAHALTCKGAFAEIERDGSGRPTALWPLTPERVEPLLKQQKLPNGRIRTELYYRVDGDDRNIIDARDMIHLHGLGYDGYCGYDTINAARQAIGLALSAEKFGASVFAAGRFGGLLTTEDLFDPTEEQKTELQTQIQKYKQGFEQFLLLWGAKWKYEKTAMGPQDTQMEAIRDQQVEEVARFFNMPLHKLKLNKPGAVSYASVEMSDLDYYKGPILNWVTLWEEELNRKLISPLEQKQQYIKHNANAFLRGDIKSRYDALGIALDKGVINADEWRELEDMNPQPAGQGKLYLVQGAMIPKNKIEAMADATIEHKTKPTPAPQAPTEPDDPERQKLVETLVAEIEAAKTAEAAALERAQKDRDDRTELDGRLAAHLAEIERLQERERQAVADAGALSGRLSEMSAECSAARTRQEETANELTAARVMVEVVQARLSDAQETVDRMTEGRIASETELAAVRATADATRSAETDRLTRMQAALDAAVAAHGAATASYHELDRAHDALRQQVSDLQKDVIAAKTAVDDAERRLQTEMSSVASLRSQLEAAGQEEADALAVQIQSHYELVVSIMRRMVERETDKGRQAQGTDAKRQKWLDTFYDAHADLMRKSLLPAIRIHLAFIRSTDDPIETTRRVVESHVQQSQVELRQVLEGDADAASVTALFYRWDQDRPTQLADRLMAKELDYARRR